MAQLQHYAPCIHARNIDGTHVSLGTAWKKLFSISCSVAQAPTTIHKWFGNHRVFSWMSVTCSLWTHFKGNSLMTTTKSFREQRKLFTQSVTLCEVSFMEGIGRFYLRLIQTALDAFPISSNFAAIWRLNPEKRSQVGTDQSQRDECLDGSVWDPEYAEDTQIGTVLNSQGRLVLVWG